MSSRNFILYLQQLLTMLDPKNEYSIALAKNALTTTIALAEVSGKVDPKTLRAMHTAEKQFQELALHAKDFAGKPGHFEENEQKRRRLEMFLFPYC